MKLFKNILSWFRDERHLFYLFLTVLTLPNLLLSITEPMSAPARIANVLFPAGCYWLLLSLMRNCGKMVWLMFPLTFFAAFQIVLLYLYGRSVIAVDMLLNVVTTNAGEAMELLDNLAPVIALVVVLYVPPLIMATSAILRRAKLSREFITRNRHIGAATLGAGCIALATAYISTPGYTVADDLYPVNVGYNLHLAIDRTKRLDRYAETSAGFTYGATTAEADTVPRIIVLVIGETSRACNWSLLGYGRDTNPYLSHADGLAAFGNALSQSNTTHKSVPMLLSPITAEDYDDIYAHRGIITAFKEAGYATTFLSTQGRNGSFIDFFGCEADNHRFLREELGSDCISVVDNDLLPAVKRAIDNTGGKRLIVLHTYGSHFDYTERYDGQTPHFTPDRPVKAEPKHRDNLINSYDNTIRYTDQFLAKLIIMLEACGNEAAMVYTSDHGEDIYDDDRQLFLHASPVPSYYQLHVPFLVWMSTSYRTAHPASWEATCGNTPRTVASSVAFFHTALDLACIQSTALDRSKSVASHIYKESPLLYLDDHNEAVPLPDMLGLQDMTRLADLGIVISDPQIARR